ncbi:CapA family protein [Natronolimnobius sp. AArcel1]|uniref:CapA family protein n=1 Tax=Natronolimnobius sp. AArcel1 TaxID=1679093 RepID=UPI0013EC13D7|nr:CapA family protein [Natronolimnobius sp. AArcel1]NGM71308.1 CapA family protein [Natronolimnobius sp. AArcel1]
MNDLSPSTCTIAATGDSIITRRVSHLIDRTEGFAELRSVLSAADTTVTNLEVLVPNEDASATPSVPVPSQYQYLSPLSGVLMRADPYVLDELDALGIDIFTTTSNHSFDYGRSGICSTAAALNERRLPFAGMGETLVEARRPTYCETSGGRAGLVAATTSVPPGSEAGNASSIHPGRPGINPLHLRWVYGATAEQLEQLRHLADTLGVEEMKSTWLDRSEPGWDDGPYFWFMHMPFEEVDSAADVGVRYEPLGDDRRAYLGSVADAAKNADRTIATLHSHQSAGGVRNTSETPDFLRAFARECIDEGADIFVVTGPHVLRGMEIYDGCPIFYSLGNLFYQTETIERLPPESFEFYGVDDPTAVTDLFDSRYTDIDGNPIGSLAREEYWETIVPVCEFSEDGLESVRVYPCTLGQNRDRPQRGTPVVASGEYATEILERFESLSSPASIDLHIEDNIGVVEP